MHQGKLPPEMFVRQQIKIVEDTTCTPSKLPGGYKTMALKYTENVPEHYDTHIRLHWLTNHHITYIVRYDYSFPNPTSSASTTSWTPRLLAGSTSTTSCAAAHHLHCALRLLVSQSHQLCINYVVDAATTRRLYINYVVRRDAPRLLCVLDDRKHFDIF
jgi:hypothetical protein